MATYIPQKAEDAAAADGDLAVPVLGVRNDSNASRTGTDGDYGNLAIDGSGHPQVVGSIAHDSPDANAPVKIGGKARQTNPTAVTDADRVDSTFDDLGRLVTVPHQVRDLVNSEVTTITSSTTATAVVTADTSNLMDIVALVFANTSSTGTEVQLLDQDGTTVRMTFYVPATDVRGIVFSVPLKQTKSATSDVWKVKTVTSIASLKITVQYLKQGT